MVKCYQEMDGCIPEDVQDSVTDHFNRSANVKWIARVQ